MNGLRAGALGVVGGLCALLLWAAPVHAQTIELKLSDWVPPSHPLNTTGFVQWADAIAKSSGGTLKVRIFPAQQLGQAKDHYDMARDGIVDFGYINPGYTAGRFPIIAAGELPFLMSNAKDGSAALDEWYRPYAKTEMADVHYCLAFVHDPSTIHARKMITKPEEIRGMKVRPADATIANLVASLGGSSVQVSAPEAREALERGVADAITFPWNSLILFGIDKSVTYHMDAPFYVTTFVIVMNKARYDGLGAAQKKAIDENCNAPAAKKVAEGWADWEAAGRELLLKNPAHHIYPISAADLSAWRKAAEPLRQTWANDVRKAGQDPDKVMRELEATLKKYNSAS